MNRSLILALLTLTALATPSCGSDPPRARQALTPAAERSAAVAGPKLQVAAGAAVPTTSSVADLVERVAATVVNINTVQHASSRGPGMHPFEFFFPEGMPRMMPRERRGAGSGFIIDPAGYIVTNAHVVRGADEVTVKLRDDRSYTAEVVGRDRKLDLALLEVKGADNLPAATLGHSDALRVGETVMAVGNPFGLGHTVTLGIVSAKARTIGAGPYDDFIQTDASINPGNSGGPLFNLRGEVVGINTAIRAGADGIGFAIPVQVLEDVVDQLKSKGYVERGKLGLAFQAIDADLAKALGLSRPGGALVSEVLDGSAAARAGIRAGDVIVGIDGVDIHHAEELPRNVARHAPGSTISVRLLRNHRTLTVRAQLDKLEEEDSGPPLPRHAGKSSAAKASRLGVEVDEDPHGGVRVVAASAGQKHLRPGDRILEVDGQAVKNVAALRRRLAAHTGGGAVLLKIERRGRSRFVGVPLGD